MEIQISPQKRVKLEAITRLYNTQEVFVQWRDMEPSGSDWTEGEGNSHVEKIADQSNIDVFVAKTEQEKISDITAFIITRQVTDVPEVTVNNSLDIPISPLEGGIERTVQVYDMKINYSEKWVKLYTRCVYSDNRLPNYVILTADNDVLLPDGQGGQIGEYDYLYYRVNIAKESLIDVQTDIIQMRSTIQGGAKWD